MTCSSCNFLNELDEKKGKVSGACYYCKNKNCYINGSDDKCERFEKSYRRNSYECDNIYKEGLKYYNDDTPLEIYIIFLIFLIITGIIINFINI